MNDLIGLTFNRALGYADTYGDEYRGDVAEGSYVEDGYFDTYYDEYDVASDAGPLRAVLVGGRMNQLVEVR